MLSEDADGEDNVLEVGIGEIDGFLSFEGANDLRQVVRLEVWDWLNSGGSGHELDFKYAGLIQLSFSGDAALCEKGLEAVG